jgi:UDPglucose 6-dehydrogenase
MKITVIGTGYVGLVAGACFADNGNQVICLDIDPEKISALKRGEIPIYEPGLEALVHRAHQEGRLHFTTSYADAIPSAEVIFLAVGTPALPSGEPDTRALRAAAIEVGRHMNGYKIIVNKSTVPIGSHLVVREWVASSCKHDFDIVSNPEFLKEGSAVNDFLKPDRVVIGTEKEEVYKKMADLYSTFCRQGNPIVWMDTVSAEITKYACNAFLATRISFMNELSRLCEKVGGDIEQVRTGMASDVRIGKHFLFAGPGYGGSCFPKDVQALITTGERYNIDLSIVTATENANEKQKQHVVTLLDRYFNQDWSGKKIGIWGLAFKPNTDDIREAPALVIIEEALKRGAKIKAFDPVAMENVKSIIGEKITLCKTSYDAAESVDALILVTEWNEFRGVDFNRVRLGMSQPVLFDTRNIYNPQKMQELGFKYFGIGRGKYTL